MTNTTRNQYTPDSISPPGETLEEMLEERGMSQAELAERTGRPKKTINEIIKGKAEITAETALQLELVLGAPARFWIESERLYREFLARKAENQRLKEYLPWLKQIPCKEMIKRGWIQDRPDKIDRLREILNFFAVVSPEQWKEIWHKNLTVDFRKSRSFESDTGAMTAWLRRGEIEAADMTCADYNAEKFREVLRAIRSLTVEPIEVFKPRMIDLCADAGVALVLIPELPKTGVCGATRWLTPNKALIQLSDRYKTDDHFWFSFFHESGHILLHGKRDVFLETLDREDTEKEKQADIFAADLLIAPKEWERFIRENSRAKDSILTFADRIGIAPGIIVGRLQHEKLLPYQNCNNLKRSIDWKNEDS